MFSIDKFYPQNQTALNNESWFMHVEKKLSKKIFLINVTWAIEKTQGE